MEDGFGLIAAEVGAAVVCEEAVNFPLTLVLGSEALRIDWNLQTEWIWCDWLTFHFVINNCYALIKLY